MKIPFYIKIRSSYGNITVTRSIEHRMKHISWTKVLKFPIISDHKDKPWICASTMMLKTQEIWEFDFVRIHAFAPKMEIMDPRRSSKLNTKHKKCWALVSTLSNENC